MGTAYTPEDISGGVNTETTINANWDAIQTALGRCLNVYGDSDTGVNAMQVDLDMNSQDILNGGIGNFTDLVVGGTSIATQVAAAAASAAAAAASETNASTSESNASASASAASTSETNAATSETNAAASEAAVAALIAAFAGDIDITDNSATAFKVHENSQNYILINTTDGSEIITIGNATTNPDTNFEGVGTVSFGGDVLLSSATSPTITLTDTTNTVSAFIQSDDTAGYVGTVTTHPFYIYVDNSALVTMTTAGKIGFGCTPETTVQYEFEDAADPDSVSVVKITQDDENLYGLVIGNDTYNTSITSGLAMYVTNSGQCQIDGRGTNLLLEINNNTVVNINNTKDVGFNCTPSNAHYEFEDGGTGKSVIVKITGDDDNLPAFVIGNDTFSTTDTSGLSMLVTDAGVSTIQGLGTGGGLQLGVTVDLDALNFDATDGGLYTGGATGGSKGTGTINAKGIYVDGVSVATAATSVVAKIKDGSTSITSSTTYTVDEDLTGFSLEQDTWYAVEGCFKVGSASATPDIKIGLAVDNAQQSSWYDINVVEDDTGFPEQRAIDSTSGGTNIWRNTYQLTAANIHIVHIKGYIRTNASSATSLDVEWAQNTSDANATTMYAGSWLKFTKML